MPLGRYILLHMVFCSCSLLTACFIIQNCDWCLPSYLFFKVWHMWQATMTWYYTELPYIPFPFHVDGFIFAPLWLIFYSDSPLFIYNLGGSLKAETHEPGQTTSNQSGKTIWKRKTVSPLHDMLQLMSSVHVRDLHGLAAPHSVGAMPLLPTIYIHKIDQPQDWFRLRTCTETLLNGIEIRWISRKEKKYTTW